MSKFRLALVRQKYRPDGGAERFVSRALEALDSSNLELNVITREWQGPVKPEWNIRICNPRKWGRISRERGFADAARRLWQAENFDLVQSHERIPGCDLYRAGDGVHRRHGVRHVGNPAVETGAAPERFQARALWAVPKDVNRVRGQRTRGFDQRIDALVVHERTLDGQLELPATLDRLDSLTFPLFCFGSRGEFLTGGWIADTPRDIEQVGIVGEGKTGHRFAVVHIKDGGFGSARKFYRNAHVRFDAGQQEGQGAFQHLLLITPAGFASGSNFFQQGDRQGLAHKQGAFVQALRGHHFQLLIGTAPAHQIPFRAYSFQHEFEG